jgi:hypothetical protein
MKNIFVFCVLSAITVGTAFSQFRGAEPQAPSVSEAMVKPSGGTALFGFFNPDNFKMSHSISMNYMSFGGQGVGMTMYTNSMQYRVSDPLLVSADVSMMFSPFGSAARSFQNDINKIFLNRARIDYMPSKDFHISLQYRNIPMNYASPYSSGYGMYGGFSRLYDEDWP